MPIMLITTLHVCHPTGERTGSEMEWDRKKVVHCEEAVWRESLVL